MARAGLVPASAERSEVRHDLRIGRGFKPSSLTGFTVNVLLTTNGADIMTFCSCLLFRQRDRRSVSRSPHTTPAEGSRGKRFQTVRNHRGDAAHDWTRCPIEAAANLRASR